MSKRILVLEPSSTTQAICRSKLKKTDFEAVFETNGIKMLVSMYNTLPAAVLINARNMNPKSTELVRLIKSVEKLRRIPIGVYSTSDFSFENQYKINTGADLFIHFDTDDLPERLECLIKMAEENKLAKPMQSDILKSGIAQRIFEYMKNLDNLSLLVGNFMNLIMEFCEVPAVSIYLNEQDCSESFYVCSQNFTESEINDFLKVCTSDFEDIFPDTNLLMVTPQRMEAMHPIEKYHSGDIPLSAFQSFPINSSDGNVMGTVNIVREGAFTTYQIDLLSFCVQLFSYLIENSIALKKKLKFERNVRKAFSRFVPESIIDDLVNKTADQTDKVGVGEKREIAILFSDIRSFTSISELNKPETIVAFLNRYFTTMCNIIKKHGGTVDKFIGDAIMALFGAPKSYEDNSRRAVAAAYEMREALESVPLEDLILPAGMKFNIGIGIHYGDVIVGSIGSDEKTDYSVIGDNVNLASRMEGLTKNYGSMILVTEAVRKNIMLSCNNADNFIFRYLDDVKVKGKEKSVPIFAIDRSLEEFSPEYRDYYTKGFELYKIGTWDLAKEYFDKALIEVPDDKAALLMLERCKEFMVNPPEKWDGAITYHTK